MRKENVYGMSPESLILVILTTSAFTGTTVAKAISKGLEALESLWKQGWAGYKNFPHSFPHLNGVHVNHHSWHESGPVPMGLPVEGILERKDHPYHQLVKMLTQSKSPIATHLVQGSRQVKAAVKPLVHVFRHDRLYAQKEESGGGHQESAQLVFPMTFAPQPVLHVDNLSNYLLPEENYMLHQELADLVPHDPSFSSTDASDPEMMLMSTLRTAESQVHYPLSEDQLQDAFFSLPTHMTHAGSPVNQDATGLLLQAHPLPVYAPISPHRPLTMVSPA